MIKLSRIVCYIFILYYFWYQVVNRSIPFFSQFLCLLLLLIVMVCMIKDRYIIIQKFIPKELSHWWFAFAVYIGSFGLLICKDQTVFTNGLILFYSSLLFCVLLCYVIYKSNDVDWFFSIMVVTCILLSISALRNGSLMYGRIILGERSNSNTIGVTLTFGVVSSLFLIKRNLAKSVFNLGALVLFTYVIILTGSRKAFLASGVLVLYWMIFVFRQQVKSYSTVVKVMYYLLLIAFAVGGIYYLSISYNNSIIGQRLTRVNEDYSFLERLYFYKEGWEFFKERPIFGLGFKQYEVYSSRLTYSHSTYIELIACTGIIGTCLFLTPIIISLRKYLAIKKTGDVNDNYKMWGIVMLIILFLGSSIIWFYELLSMIFFTLFFGYVNSIEGFNS